MNKDLYLIGGGGHCRACIEVIEAQGSYRIAGIVDRPEKIGENNLGIQVVASDQDLQSLVLAGAEFLISIGQIGGPGPRQRIFTALKAIGAVFPTIVSPHGWASPYAQIGEGTIVMHGTIVNAAAQVGANCILNTRCIIEHDARIFDNCHVSTGAVVNGGCRIGAGSFIGSNSVLVHGVSIAAGAVVGAGSVVHRDIDEAGTYVGNPCRRIR